MNTRQIKPLALTSLSFSLAFALSACATTTKMVNTDMDANATKQTNQVISQAMKEDWGYQCDTLASMPFNADNPINIKSMKSKDVDVEKAIETCTKAIKIYPKVDRYQFNLGRTYANNDEGTKAYSLLKPLVDKRYPDAFTILGNLYDSGSEGVEQSYSEANKLYRQGANIGSAVSQYNFGSNYYCGSGFEQSYEEAMKLYQKSAGQGYYNAQYQLGVMYEKGYGVEVDYKKAFDWYKKAAKQGLAEAQGDLGRMYQYSKGVEQSYSKAVAWYRKSAKQGNSDAQFRLVWMYEKGYGVSQSYKQALKWYLESAEQYDADAMTNIGYFYSNGYGVEQSDKKALEYYLMAVDYNDDERALNNIGDYYEHGQAGLEQSYKKAMEYYLLSAEQDDELAMYNIAQLYEEGNGVEKSLTKPLNGIKNLLKKVMTLPKHALIS